MRLERTVPTMKVRTSLLSISLFAGCFLGTAACGSPARDASGVAHEDTRSLQSVCERAEQEGQGHLGIAALHVESGERFAFHGDDRFPMQSVFKLPLAIELLARVDAGDVRLDEEVTIRPSDLRPGPGGALADELPNGGTRPMLALLERMVMASDNTAADLLLERVGGARKVTDRLRAFGIEGVDVSRSEAELWFDFTGVTQRPPRETWTLAKLEQVTNTPPAVRSRALAIYLADPRDTAKPSAMVDLLLRVHQRKVLSPENGERLVSILERTTTGKKRLRGLLPPETVVAHKTGMSDTTDGVTAATNDVGIITLPGQAGHLVIAAFLSNSKADDDTRDRAIATVSRALVDHFSRR